MINKLEICGLTKHFGEKKLFEDSESDPCGACRSLGTQRLGQDHPAPHPDGAGSADSGTVQAWAGSVLSFRMDLPAAHRRAERGTGAPGGKTQYKTRMVSDFNDLDMISRRLPCLPEAFRRAEAPCGPAPAPSGPGATLCCWTNPSPVWTGDRGALLKERRANGLFCWPPMTGKPSGCWGGGSLT